MSLVSLFNQGFSYPSRAPSNGDALSLSDSSASSRASSAVPSSQSASGSVAGLAQDGASTPSAAPDSGAWDDGADTTYTPAYVRLSANASSSAAASQTDDTTKATAGSGTANPMADAQKHFTSLLARLDAAVQKTKEPSAANDADAASIPSSDAASTARLKAVIAAYADNMTGRAAAFSV